MSFRNIQSKTRNKPHPYLSGNFAPVHAVQSLTTCSYTGKIPSEIIGGEYVRNGGNPVAYEDLGRDAHWFDGDGMLSGVWFKRIESGVQPQFVNQYILTDVLLSTLRSKSLRKPILPSITTLINPLSSLYVIISTIFRTILLVLMSHLPGSQQTIKKISVANTGILYHDGRALATCESGPPMRVALPGLETIGWYNGKAVEGEKDGEEGSGFGGDKLLSFLKEWTTAHPRVDPRTGELVLFHSTFAPPYIHYSIVPARFPPATIQTPFEAPSRLLNAPIPGVKSAKMMHDFGVSFDHTVILDLPLSLDPFNLIKNQPVVSYNPRGRSRFGVFPRHSPQSIRWFETDPCCVFHTANTWDETVVSTTGEPKTVAVNMLACRLNSAALIYSAGDIAAPRITGKLPMLTEDEQCRLYYYQFSMNSEFNLIRYQFALSAIPFEFPSTREDKVMSASRYIYGCSTTQESFSAALGRAVKIDCLVKIDVSTLIKKGCKDMALTPVTGCVDQRNVEEILLSTDRSDPIQIFKLPPNHYAQEPRFVPRLDGSSKEVATLAEDDGFLLTYVFDETQLDENGECLPDAKSELWVIDAKDMTTVVAKVQLPMRVPYGLHGGYFSEQQVSHQRPVESIRSLASLKTNSTGRSNEPGAVNKLWMSIRRSIEGVLG